jgi:ankyrin repeat protein
MHKHYLFKIICAILLFIPLLECNTKSKDGKETETVEPTSGVDDGFEWRLYEGEVSITKYNDTKLDVVIPAVIRGHPVTRIGNDVFKKGPYSENKINSVTIPEGVTKIGDYAFYCNNIASITLPDSLTHIGRHAFHFNGLSSVTIPESVSEIDILAFINNPLHEICVKAENLRSLPHYVFNLDIPGYLPPGTYVQKDEQWFFQDSDGTLLPILSYFDKLITDKPGVLDDIFYDAVSRLDMEQFKMCISRGADINGRMRGGQEITPLAAIFGDPSWTIGGITSRRDYDKLYSIYRERAVEMTAILLSAGVLPQRWMLCYSYYQPDIVKMLLERGALTNPESPEYGNPPAYYQRPESMLFHYCQSLVTGYNTGYELNPMIAESAALLLEHGEDANYRDPAGRTPLDLAMHIDILTMEMAGLLYKHKPRPLPHEEYILLVGLNQERVWGEWMVGRWRQSRVRHINPEDPCGFDAMVLEDIRKGFLNPERKDENGKDIFDYAVETGTAGLMEGLIPYLLKSKRTIIARDRTGLYFDAIKAQNAPIAAVLSRAMNNKFTERDSRGNEYSLEYYAFDYDTVYYSAQKIPHYSLYRSGPGGTRRIGGEQTEVAFSANRFYTTMADRWKENSLSLHAVDGKVTDLGTVINEQREQYYRENGREKPNDSNPIWSIDSIFGDILYARTPWYYEHYYSMEYALVDISGNNPTVYILESDNKVRVETRYFADVIDFVINAGKAYLIRKSGEVIICTVEKNTLRFERTVSWRESRIPGWRGGEHYFVADEILTAYNFATGRARPLGKKIELPGYYSSGYGYEDANGRRFITGEGGKAYPVPEDEKFKQIITFDRGYIYDVKEENYRVICFFENGVLKRKIVLSGSAVWGDSPSLHENKLYLGMYCLALSIDLTSMRVSKAFSTPGTGNNSSIDVNIFPFGTDDVGYTIYHDGGK